MGRLRSGRRARPAPSAQLLEVGRGLIALCVARRLPPAGPALPEHEGLPLPVRRPSDPPTHPIRKTYEWAASRSRSLWVGPGQAGPVRAGPVRAASRQCPRHPHCPAAGLHSPRMTAYTWGMSNHDSTPAARPTTPSTDRPTATYPTRRSILAAAGASQPERSPLSDWRGQCPTEELPAIAARPAVGRPRVSTPAKPTGSRVARRRPTLRRHLRAALAGILIAAALLIPMQLYAAAGISSARQAALASARTTQATEQAAPAPAAQPDVRTDIQADWVTEDTGAAYDRTDPSASPRSLPRCTTSPDTPLPCLATISPDSKRAVVLEEDASLTALVRR